VAKSELAVKFTGDPADLVKAFERVGAAQEKLARSLENNQRSTRSLGEEMERRFARSFEGSITRIGVKLLSLNTAINLASAGIRQVVKELDEADKRAVRASEERQKLAPVERRLAQAMSGYLPEERKKVEDWIDQTAKTKGIPKREVLAETLAETLPITRELPLAKALAEQAVEVYPGAESGDDAKALSKLLGGVSRTTGIRDPRLLLGIVETVKQQTGIASVQELVGMLPELLGGAGVFKTAPGSALAILQSMRAASRGALAGPESVAAATKLQEQISELFPEGGAPAKRVEVEGRKLVIPRRPAGLDTFDQQMEWIWQQDEKARKAIASSIEIRSPVGKKIVREMLEPKSEAAAEYRRGREAFADEAPMRQAAERLIKAPEGGRFEPQAKAERRFDASLQGIRLSDPFQAAAGFVSERLSKMVKESGATDIEGQLHDLVLQITPTGMPRLDLAAKVLRERASTLRSTTEYGYSELMPAPGMVAPQHLRVPTPAELKNAENLETAAKEAEAYAESLRPIAEQWRRAQETNARAKGEQQRVEAPAQTPPGAIEGTPLPLGERPRPGSATPPPLQTPETQTRSPMTSEEVSRTVVRGFEAGGVSPGFAARWGERIEAAGPTESAREAREIAGDIAAGREAIPAGERQDRMVELLGQIATRLEEVRDETRTGNTSNDRRLERVDEAMRGLRTDARSRNNGFGRGTILSPDVDR
jgi:hypothetical protein